MDETLRELVDQLEDPAVDHVGPYEKSGDNESLIIALFADYGYVINDEGFAVKE